LPAAANGQSVERLAFVIGGTSQIHPLAAIHTTIGLVSGLPG
jgi:hypothetical protein